MNWIDSKSGQAGVEFVVLLASSVMLLTGLYFTKELAEKKIISMLNARNRVFESKKNFYKPVIKESLSEVEFHNIFSKKEGAVRSVYKGIF